MLAERFAAEPVEATRRARALMLAAAVLVFALGIAVYLIDRPAGYLKVLPSTWGGLSVAAPVFGALGGVLPSFAHAFAFPILTAATMRTGWARFGRVCAAWALLHTLFEVGQSRVASGWIAALLAPAVDAWAPLGRVSRYFTAGTWDAGDLGAAWLGALAAAALGRALLPPASAQTLPSTARQ